MELVAEDQRPAGLVAGPCPCQRDVGAGRGAIDNSNTQKQYHKLEGPDRDRGPRPLFHRTPATCDLQPESLQQPAGRTTACTCTRTWPLLGLGLAFPGHPWVLSTKRRPLAVFAPPSPPHMSWQLRSGSNTNGLAISSPRPRPAVVRQSRVPGQWYNTAHAKTKRGPGGT
jgi:hypothetical protein